MTTRISFSLLFVLLLIVSGYSQKTMHDFTVTDTHGKSHNLYNDYLSKEGVVVIKFFFTSCPPCIANAPLWQQKYVELGSGTKKIEFFSVSTLTSDNNAGVAAFESQYNQTMKGVGNDGNAKQVTDPFRNGTYGSWWGTPSFVVIAPDKSFKYPVFFNELDAAITEAKSKTSVVTIPPTTVTLNLPSTNVDIPQGHVKFFIKPKNASTPKIVFIFIGIPPTLLFWFLDSYYLLQERKIRGVYNDVTGLKQINHVRLYEIPIEKYTKEIDKQFSFWNVFLSKTIMWLYLSMIVFLVIIGVLLNFKRFA